MVIYMLAKIMFLIECIWNLDTLFTLGQLFLEILILK